MKLTWLSNAPWTSTGYGQQTALFGTRLVKKGIKIGVISNYGHQGATMNWNGIEVFGNSYHPYCMDVMHGHTETFGADALLTLLDLQVMEPQHLNGTKWIAWTPIDHHNAPPYIVHQAKKSDVVISMSKHGSAELEKNGVENYYIPCGVDTDVMKPYNKVQAREEMHLPTDKFMVGMVAMNKGVPSRKAFQQNIAAFAALKKKHDDCVMYIHTMDGLRGPNMENLPEFISSLGLRYGYHMSSDVNSMDIIFANQYGMVLGYESTLMAKLFSSFDVLTSVTMGEGFGIPVIEAQACGTPVIVGDWTATSELCYGGWKVDREDAEPIFTTMSAWQYMPHAVAIAERMEAAYQMRGNPDYMKRAIAGAQLYDADKLIENKWLPTLEKIGQKLQEIPSRVAKQLEVLR